MPQIEVTFDIDADGIVHVSAKDKASGKEQSIRIQASGGLSEADIQRMVREAEANVEQDRRRKELVETRNQADAAVYRIEKAMQEFGERIPAELKGEVGQLITRVKDTMQGEDIGRVREAVAQLEQAGQRLAGVQQHGSGAGSSQSSGTSGGHGDADVIDAEFEELDDKDRKTG